MWQRRRARWRKKKEEEEDEKVGRGRDVCVTGEQCSSIGLLWSVKTRSD